MAPGAVGESSEPGQLFERAYFPEERQGRVEAFKNTLGDRWVEYFSEGVGDRLTLGLGKALSGTSRVGRYVRRLGTRPGCSILSIGAVAFDLISKRRGGAGERPGIAAATVRGPVPLDAPLNPSGARRSSARSRSRAQGSPPPPRPAPGRGKPRETGMCCVPLPCWVGPGDLPSVTFLHIESISSDAGNQP